MSSRSHEKESEINVGSCQYIKENGSRCGSITGINYLYYRDAQSMWNGEKEICQSHSDQVFGKLLIHSQNIKTRMNNLQGLRKKIWKKEKEHDRQVLELEREVIIQLQSENKLPSSNEPNERKRVILDAMQSEVWRRIKHMGQILRDHRNKTCRLCLHELLCNCQEQCKLPDNPRHWGDKISSVTLFSQKLYRRETFNFHIVCGRIFISMFGINLLPTKEKQTTLLQSIKDLK